MGSGICDLGSSRSNCLENHDSNNGGPDGPPVWSKVIIIISINSINILIITHYHPLHHHHHGQDHPDYSDTVVWWLCGQRKTSSGPTSDLATCLL